MDSAAANNMRTSRWMPKWYGPEFGKDSDPLKGGKVAQVLKIISYGKARNVGIWLYLNDVGGGGFRSSGP